MESTDGRFEGDDPPEAPPFDSMANLRALGDIQRRGLEAANLVIGRLVAQVDRSGPLFGAEPAAEENGHPAAGPGVDLATLVGQYSSLMSSYFATLLGGSAPGATSAAAAGAAAAGGVAADPLAVSPTPPGERGQGELWLHNRSGAMVTDIRLHCGDLRRHDGWAIPATAVSFEPAHLDELPDLSSRGIRVAVDVPGDAPPGTYRGTVLASNLPDLWLDVALEVVAAP